MNNLTWEPLTYTCSRCVTLPSRAVTVTSLSWTFMLSSATTVSIAQLPISLRYLPSRSFPLYVCPDDSSSVTTWPWKSGLVPEQCIRRSRTRLPTCASFNNLIGTPTVDILYMQKEEYSMVKASAVVVVVAGEGLEGSSDKKCLAVGTRRKPCKRCDSYAQTVFLSGTFFVDDLVFPFLFYNPFKPSGTYKRTQTDTQWQWTLTLTRFSLTQAMGLPRLGLPTMMSIASCRQSSLLRRFNSSSALTTSSVW